MAKFHPLKYESEGLALAMARRLAELSFEVFWTPTEPKRVLYTQAPYMPTPATLQSDGLVSGKLRPIDTWQSHGIIDTRK